MLDKITFDNLPQAVSMLLEKLDRIERSLDEKNKTQGLPPILDIKGAAELSGRTENAIRCQVSLGNIPYFKRDRRLHFETDKFLAWMRGEKIEDHSDPLDLLEKNRK